MHDQLLHNEGRKPRLFVRRWMAGLLAGVMAMSTAVALAPSAFAQEETEQKETSAYTCGLEEHTHTEDCYKQVTIRTEKVLSCTLVTQPAAAGEEAVVIVHEHDASCYDAEGTLVCTLTERETHTHTDACYSNPVLHVHNESCYETSDTPVCGKTEVQGHKHTDECSGKKLTCELHVCDDTCATPCTVEQDPHVHTGECYQDKVCNLEEAEAHTHTEDCYKKLICGMTEGAVEDKGELTCGKEELILHSHSVDNQCYLLTYNPNGTIATKELTCQTPVVEQHIHTDACFTTVETPAADLNTLTCGKEESEEHTHTERCYGTWELTCGLEEHTHDETCDPLTGLSEEDRAKVQAVIDAVDKLPEYTEIEKKMLAFEDAGDTDGMNGYYMEIAKAVQEAYKLYEALGEELQKYITDRDKLVQLYSVFGTMVLNATPDVVENVPTVDSVSVPGVTVQLFNYDSTIHNLTGGLSEAGYKFFHSKDTVWGDEDSEEWGTFEKWQKQGTVDGIRGYEDGEDTGTYQVLNSGNYNKPQMTATLGNDGYPQATLPNDTLGSFSPYFGSTYRKASISNGGGLFRKDSNGYYIYDSAQNAAYFNGKNFILYDGVVRPIYIETTSTTAAQYCNFLPFNSLNGNVCSSPADETIDGINQKQYQLTEDAPADLWFGMTVDFEFFMPKGGQVNGGDMVFDFHGDDDVFVYLGIWDGTKFNYKLVLDIGGTHAAQSGTINFASGIATDPNGNADGTNLATIFGEDYSQYFENGTFKEDVKLSLKFFYMERGGNISYCRLRFNIPTLPAESLTVKKELESSGKVEIDKIIENEKPYTFRVVKADDSSESYFGEQEVAFTYMNADGTSTGKTGKTDAKGEFELRVGEIAQFTNMLQYAPEEDGIKQDKGYIVQEIVPNDLTGIFNGVAYELSGSTNTLNQGDKTTDFTTYSTQIMYAKVSNLVVYRNKVDTQKLGTLKIKKDLDTYDDADTASRDFTVQVKINDDPLPEGDWYGVTVGKNGAVTVSSGQTVEIKNIMGGSTYEVVELNADGYTVTYTDSASGEMPLPSGDVTPEVSVTIRNEENGIAPEISVKKTLTNPTNDAHTYYFTWVEGTYENGTFTETGTKTTVPLTMEANKGEETLALFTPKYTLKMLDGADFKEFYYQIYESDSDGMALADTGAMDADQTVYVVKVTVTKDSDGSLTASQAVSKDRGAFSETGRVEFTNTLLGTLSISKELKLEDGSTVPADKTFTMTVKCGNDYLPKDTEYKIGTAAHKVGENGTIGLKAGETALIGGLKVGDTYTVTETVDSAYGYGVAYAPASTVIAEKTDKVPSVSIRVTNTEQTAELAIGGTKTIANPDGKKHEYTFQMQELDANGRAIGQPVTQTVNTDASGSFEFPVSYRGTDLNGQQSRTYYYQIRETTPSDLTVATDPAVYLVTVKLESVNGDLKAISSIQKTVGTVETPQQQITFTNTLLGSLTLRKQIVGEYPQGETFTFTVKGLPDGTYGASLNGESTAVTVVNQTCTVKLGHKDSLVVYGIPHGTSVTVTEAKSAYTARYLVNSGWLQRNGNTVTTGVTTSGTEILFKNYSPYGLPQTGQLNWPIPVLAILGLACVGGGFFLLRRKKGKHEK